MHFIIIYLLVALNLSVSRASRISNHNGYDAEVSDEKVILASAEVTELVDTGNSNGVYVKISNGAVSKVSSFGEQIPANLREFHHCPHSTSSSSEYIVSPEVFKIQGRKVKNIEWAFDKIGSGKIKIPHSAGVSGTISEGFLHIELCGYKFSIPATAIEVVNDAVLTVDPLLLGRNLQYFTWSYYPYYDRVYSYYYLKVSPEE